MSLQVSSRLSYPIQDKSPQIRTWLAGAGASGRCRSVGTESQISDKIPKLEEVPMMSPQCKHKFGKLGGKIKSPVEPFAPVSFDDTAMCEIKQKFSTMTSSSSEELSTDLYFTLDEPSRSEDTAIQRSSSVADYLNCKQMTPTDQRRRHSLTSLNDTDQVSEEKKEDENEQPSTWIKVKNLIYNRRESLKKKSTDKPQSDYEFLDEMPNPSVSKSKSDNDKSVRKVKPKNPDLVLCNPDLLETKVFSLSLNSMKTDQKADPNYLSPKSFTEETSHSLPTSPHVNPDDVFLYDDCLLEDKSNEQMNVSTDSKDTEQLEAVREIQRDYEQLKRSLSEEFKKKRSVWSQKKSSRDNGCQSVTDESQLSADFRRKLEEWQRIKRREEINSDNINNDDVVVQLHQDRSQELEFPSFPWHRPKDKSMKPGDIKTSSSGKIRARPANQKTLIEDDLKPEYKLKLAEWEVQKAMAGHSNRVSYIIYKNNKIS